jgi:hypothetical protein
MPNHLSAALVAWQAEKMPSPSLTRMGLMMDFESEEFLHEQFSYHFTQLLGEEVKVSKQEALFIATVVWTGAARLPRELSQVKP